ncbi:MAG: ATP-binding cassette, subfamily bacterial [Candidatus Woesearchaeota archaeon]|nr:ATP-binding cassette, subfamily bacterial [Candidatus Woesearchaeota archaeon]
MSDKLTFKERLESLKLAISWTYKSSKPLTILIFAVTIFSGLLTIIEPYIFKIIIDGVTSGSGFSIGEKIGLGLFGVLVIYAVARIIQSILWDVQSIIQRVHSQKLDKYVSSVLMDKISSLDAVYFEDPEYYNTLTKSNQNYWRINEFFLQFIFFVSEAVSVLVIIGALFTFNWLIVALILIGSLPSIIFAFKASEINWTAFDSSLPIGRHANYYKSLMTERPEVVKELKLFNLKSHFLKRYESLFDEYLSEQKKAAKKETLLFVLMGIIEGTFSVIAAWFVVTSFIQGSISIGDLTFFWSLLFQFSDHARYMVRMIGELGKNSTFITPIVKLLKFKPTIQEVKNPLIFPKKLRQGIEFRNVTFHYPREKTPALKNFNLVIKPGESIAIVGENGSGKTTLIKLLTKLYDVSSGEILIDGKNIKEYSLESLYENIGVIFQDFVKYEALVEENISFGNIKKSRKKSKVHEASVKSGAWDFIKDLKLKYKTHLGKTLLDEGVELSVGQWQKIALSRAFFKNAQILCLDEPTAAVDAKAEYLLFRRFKRLTKGKTTLLISHRFSTVRMADKIIVLDKGKLIEQGSHRELSRRGGKYAKLFRMQAEGYADYFNIQK